MAEGVRGGTGGSCSPPGTSEDSRTCPRGISSVITHARASSVARFFGVSRRPVPSWLSRPFQRRRYARYPWRFTRILQPMAKSVPYRLLGRRAVNAARPTGPGWWDVGAIREPGSLWSVLSFEPADESPTNETGGRYRAGRTSVRPAATVPSYMRLRTVFGASLRRAARSATLRYSSVTAAARDTLRARRHAGSRADRLSARPASRRGRECRASRRAAGAARRHRAASSKAGRVTFRPSSHGGRLDLLVVAVPGGGMRRRGRCRGYASPRVTDARRSAPWRARRTRQRVPGSDHRRTRPAPLPTAVQVRGRRYGLPLRQGQLTRRSHDCSRPVQASFTSQLCGTPSPERPSTRTV